MTQPTTPAQTPVTEAARKLLWGTENYVTAQLQEWIAEELDKVEATARAEALADLRQGVEGLAWTTQTDDDGGGGELVSRAAVLALLDPK